MLRNKHFSQSRSETILLLTTNVLASLPGVVVSRYFRGLNSCLFCLPVFVFFFFPKVTLPQRIVLAFGEISTNNYVMENVPYRTIAVELAAVPARGTACSGFMQEKGQRMGLVAMHVPTDLAVPVSGEKRAMPPWWSLPGAQPGGATPGCLQVCCCDLPMCSHATKCSCWQGGENGPAFLGFFPHPLLSKQTHSCKRATSVFKRRHVTFQNLNFSLDCACCHLCNLLFSRSVNAALWGCASKRG